MKTLRLIPLAAAVGLSLYSSISYGQLAQNLAIDLKSLSLGNAVTADPPGVYAVHFNPAGLAKLDGLQTDVQFFMGAFDLKREISAPDGYNVFGYSDDPIVCNDAPNNPSSLCTDYKVSYSEVEYVSLYVPILKKMVDLGKGMPIGAPTAGFSYRAPGSKITYANAFYAPLAAGFGAEDGNPGNYMGQQVAMERFTYLSPSAAYQVNDNLSIGASVGLSYQAIAMKLDMRTPNELVGVMRLIHEDVCAPFLENGNIVTDLLLFGVCNARSSIGPFDTLAQMQIAVEQSVSPSYNLGVLWEPNEKLGFGMVYQSGSKMQLKGRYSMRTGEGARELLSGLNSSVTGQILSAILGFPGAIPEYESGIISMPLEYPAHFQMGVKYKVLPDLQVNVDLGWTDNEKWKEFLINFDRSIGALSIAKLLTNNVTSSSVIFPLGLQSSWSWGVGMQYDVNDRLQVRLGYEPRPSAVPMDKRNTLIPINGAQIFGTGLTYRFDADTEIDLTYAHLRSKDRIPANTSSFANQTGVNNLIYNPYAGLDIKTHTRVNLLGLAYRTRW